jgi:hypothetical protein
MKQDKETIMSHTDYTFMDMLREIFTGKSSGRKHDDEEGYIVSDGYSGEVSSPKTSRDFDPSESAGEAFRSVFGDDNLE